MKPEETSSENTVFFYIKRSRITAAFTLILSFMVLFSCLEGIFNERIYKDLLSAGTITNFLLAGSTAQDMIFIPFAMLLIIFSIIFLIRPGYKIFITIIGLTSNFFYGYGLYTIQGQYTSIYLIYLTIFSFSIYGIVLGLLSFTPKLIGRIYLPGAIRITASIFLYLMVLMLGLVWILRILPDTIRHVPRDIYGVFILDLGIVFPAVAITATQLIRARPVGYILSGVILIKVFTVCLSWGFGEWYGRVAGTISGSYDMLVLPGVLALISLIFFIFYMRKIKLLDPQ